jgi:hypothetical protein
MNQFIFIQVKFTFRIKTNHYIVLSMNFWEINLIVKLFHKLQNNLLVRNGN